MFTGIIESVGKISALNRAQGDGMLHIFDQGLPWHEIQLGESIAVNGVCLTVTTMDGQGFTADVSNETFNCTALGSLKIGQAVNLERALTLNKPLGGHWVSGHVDGLGHVVSRNKDARSTQFVIRLPDALLRYVAAKGSITLDGISLTVNRIESNNIYLNIVPHTFEKTQIDQSWIVDAAVHVEVDIIARHLERLLSPGLSAQNSPSNVTTELLQQYGFLNDQH
ncbi:MAG: riboflavin synthase [Pseudomonadota bacterium]